MKPRYLDLWRIDWWLTAKRVWAEILLDDCFGASAQLAFYFLLAFFPFVVFLIGFVLGPIFERALRNTVNLFDDPLSLSAQHPLLPVLLALAAYTIWRSARGKRKPALINE